MRKLSNTSRHLSNYRIVLFAIFVTAYGTNVSTPFLVTYRDRLSLGPTETQLIFVVYVAGILTSLLLAGSASDRFGRKPICVPFVAMSAIGSIVIIAGRNSYPLLLLGRLILGASVGGVLGVGTAWLQELMGKGTHVRSALLTTIAAFGGFGIGPLISALLDLWAPAPLVTPFLLHVLTVAVVLVPLVRVPESHAADPSLPVVRVNLGVPPKAKALFLTAVVPAAVWIFAFPSTGFALFPVLLSSAISGFDVQVAGAASTLTAWSGLLVRPILMRMGPPNTILLGMVLGTFGYASGTVAFLTDAWPLVLGAAVLVGAASGSISAGCLAILGGLAQDKSRGALTSTFYLLAYPSMSMPVIVTLLASGSSFRVALGIITVAAAVGTGVVAVANRAARRLEA